MRKLAIITDAMVSNVIVADDSFEIVDSVDVTNSDPCPDIGWGYNGREFIPPPTPELPSGEAPTNIPESITLSEASGSMIVRMEGNNVYIGCIAFNPAWLRAVYAALVMGNETREGKAVSSRSGIKYDEFFITWEDIERINAFLTEAGLNS